MSGDMAKSDIFLADKSRKAGRRVSLKRECIVIHLSFGSG